MPEYPLVREAGLLLAYVRITGPRSSVLLRMALDTGATTTMIPQKAALAVGINPARAKVFRETLTASGKELIPFVPIPMLRIFEKTLRRIPVACHDLPSESPIDGLLGLDVLARIKAIVNVAGASVFLP